MRDKKNIYNLPGGISFSKKMFNSLNIIRSVMLLKNPIKFISKNMEKFSGTYSGIIGGNKIIITQNPDFITHVLRTNHTIYHKSELSTKIAAKLFGKGLLFSNGDYWLKQRRLIQPGFHHAKIHSLHETISSCIDEFIKDFPVGEKINIYPLMNQLAFRIVIKSLFDININQSDKNELSKTFDELQTFLVDHLNQPLKKYFYFLTGSEFNIVKKSKKLKGFFKSILENRRHSDEKYDDLLDMLINSKYEDTLESMSDEQIIEEILIIIFAGHETTANTLSWILYLLASNKLVLEKLNASIENKSTFDSIKNTYLTAVISEGMRLYPAAWITDRVVLKDDKFTEFSFPKGTIFLLFFYGVHRSNKFWTDPEIFNPERFLENNMKVKKMDNYFPFGAGPRMCIGNSFAMTEMAFFLNAFLKRYNILPTKQTPLPRPLITLRPDKVLLKIEKR